MFTTATLTIDSVVIPVSQLHGVASISRRENEASTMEVTIIPPSGLVDVSLWAGKDVTLDIDGTRAYTGTVDDPIIDMVQKKITFFCSDKRRERLNVDLAAIIGTIGFYSPAIFSETENVIDELDQRLQTIPSAVDIKPDGTYAITDMNPKTVADITITDSDVYRRQPKTSPTSRSRLTNQVDISFDYRYTRKRHREKEFKIEDLSFCDILDLGPLGSFTLKTSFYNYATSMDWLINDSSIVWEEMPFSTASTSPPCTVDIAYVQNLRFATSMTFDSSQRFSQTITENFTITVKAPQSIAQYGVVAWGQKNGYQYEYDSSEWEDYKTYSAPTGGTSDPNDYYIDEDGPSTDFDDAVLTAINIAKTKIVKSHIDTQTNFETDLRLDFDLTKTIAFNTASITAHGKITAIDHNINFETRKGDTITEISQSTAQGSQTPDAIVPPTRPTVPVVADVFVEPFVMLITDGQVVTPPVDDTSRDEQIVTQTTTYDIEIQNNNYGITL